MKHKGGDFPGIPVVDVMMNLVLVFAVLTKLLTAAVNDQHQEEQKKSMDTKALYVVKMQWAGESNDDIDLYVQDPLQNLVYFRSLSKGLMVLDHDDTGSGSNEVTLPDGTVIKSAFNEETVEIRGIVPGEYIVNVHAYRKKGDDGPCSVAVTLYKTAGSEMTKVHDETVILNDQGEERTAFRFTLTSNGEVGDINTMQTRFVK